MQASNHVEALRLALRYQFYRGPPQKPKISSCQDSKFTHFFSLLVESTLGDTLTPYRVSTEEQSHITSKNCITTKILDVLMEGSLWTAVF